MTRRRSVLAPDWWDYTTLDEKVLEAAAALTVDDLGDLARPGFEVVVYDSLEAFYLAEALEYVEAWRQATADEPVGICGPVGPTEQLPLVAQLVNALGIRLNNAHFWGMDEWVVDGKPVPVSHPLSFERADRELCFDRIDADLRMPDANMHFPSRLEEYVASWDEVRCAVLQGGQGDIKHWAFNDPPRRTGDHVDAPPSPDEYRRLATRVVELHPATVAQNARTSAGGHVASVPQAALTVGPTETWKAERISIWQAGQHDSPFGQRLTAYMVSNRIEDAAVPMSLLAGHPSVRFSYYRHGFGTCGVEMH